MSCDVANTYTSLGFHVPMRTTSRHAVTILCGWHPPPDVSSLLCLLGLTGAKTATGLYKFCNIEFMMPRPLRVRPVIASRLQAFFPSISSLFARRTLFAALLALYTLRTLRTSALHSQSSSTMPTVSSFFKSLRFQKRKSIEAPKVSTFPSSLKLSCLTSPASSQG